MPLETWEFMINLNARSVFLVSRAVVPHMLRRQAGRIINIGSRAGLKGGANMAPYAVSKGAVIRLTESMAEELKDQGITANCIVPSVLDTSQNRTANPDADYSQWVTPEQVADVITFLASENARAVNGAIVPVYGRS